MDHNIKSVFCFFLSLVLFLSGWAIGKTEDDTNGESFLIQFRNGIWFGDDREVVRSKETLKMFPAAQIQDPFKDCFYRTTVMGIEGTEVDYLFDIHNQLEQVVYLFGDDSLAAWSSIESELKDQYGSALKLLPEEHHTIVGEAILNYYDYLNQWGSVGEASIIGLSERVVEYGNYSIKVDHIYYSWKTRYMSSKSYSHILSCRYFDETTKATAIKIPDQTPSIMASNLDVAIYEVKINKNSAGTTELYVRFKNENSSDSVDRIDFIVKCYDAYGKQIYAYDYYDSTTCYYDEVLKPNHLTPSNYRWTLYGFDGTRKVEIAITKYHTTAGKTVTIPERQWNWSTWTKN